MPALPLAITVDYPSEIHKLEVTLTELCFKKKKSLFDFWQYQWQYLPYVTVEVALVIGIVDSLWKGWAKFWKLPRSPLNTQIKTLSEFSDISTHISDGRKQILYCYTYFTFQHCQDTTFLLMHELF